MDENAISFEKEISIHEKYNLYFTFTSSFGCYLFKPQTEQVNCEEWHGIVAPFQGITIRQVQNRLLISADKKLPAEVIDYVSNDVLGLWHKPNATSTDERANKILTTLSEELFPGVRIPRLRSNKYDVLASILFSIHAKVSLSRSWFASMHKAIGNSYNELVQRQPIELMGITATETGQSAGFRARYVIGAFKSLFDHFGSTDPLEEATKTNNVRARLNLMKIDYVGPKVADCFLLNAIGDVTAPPVDVNVYRVAESLGILPPYLGLPSSELCTIYACTPEQSKESGIPLCPKAERTISLLQGKTESVSGTCTRAALALKFSDAGWVQALLFLYGQHYCTSVYPNCEKCRLKEFSVREKIPDLTPIRTRTGSPRQPRIIEPHIPENIPVFNFFPEALPDCLNIMKTIITEIREKAMLHGKSSMTLFAALLWIAAKKKGIPAFPNEIAQGYDVDVRDLLSLSSSIQFTIETNLPPLQPTLYLQRLQKTLLFSDDVLKKASNTAIEIKGFSGKKPESIAAASLYITTKNGFRPFTVKEISEALGITVVTVRANSKVIQK